MIEDFPIRGGRRPVRELLIEDDRTCDFFVDDGTARVLIRADDVEIDARGFERTGFDELRPHFAALDAFITHYGLFAGSLGERAHFVERALLVGEAAVALGTTTREPDPDPAAPKAGYRTIPQHLVLTRIRTRPVLVSDDPAFQSR